MQRDLKVNLVKMVSMDPRETKVTRVNLVKMVNMDPRETRVIRANLVKMVSRVLKEKEVYKALKGCREIPVEMEKIRQLRMWLLNYSLVRIKIHWLPKLQVTKVYKKL
ncbi:MAG: hypothetical protein LBU56_03350 [Rickettsiales bacterium]|jgi:histone acetyltransferase (RNA polymerase elongator complex component)|nr:hypothetical protein [Rickettsiales bacterium]